MDEGAQTVANFLKFYNPSIVGGSLGSHIGEVSQNDLPNAHNACPCMQTD